jgi:hypothetical protein
MLSAAMKRDAIAYAGAPLLLGFQMVQQLAHAAIAASRSGEECNWNVWYRFCAWGKSGAEIRMLESCTFGGTLRKEQGEWQNPCVHYMVNEKDDVPGLWFALSDFAGTPNGASTIGRFSDERQLPSMDTVSDERASSLEEEKLSKEDKKMPDEDDVPDERANSPGEGQELPDEDEEMSDEDSEKVDPGPVFSYHRELGGRLRVAHQLVHQQLLGHECSRARPVRPRAPERGRVCAASEQRAQVRACAS